MACILQPPHAGLRLQILCCSDMYALWRYPPVLKDLVQGHCIHLHCTKVPGLSSGGCAHVLQTELKAVTTAMFTTEVVDGFQVLRSASVADTFRLYAAITHRLTVRAAPF